MQLPRISVELNVITSLNAHSPGIYSGTRYGHGSSDLTVTKESPHWPVQHPRPVRAKGLAGYVDLKHTLTAAHITTREVEIESPSTLCFFRIEGLVKSLLTSR